MAERNINDIHILMDFIIRKERGAFITEPEKDEMLNFGQWDEYGDRWNDYQAIGVLPECLEPFKVTLTFDNASSVGGKVTKPDDFQHFISGLNVIYDNVRQVADKNAIVPVEDVELAATLKSQLRPVSLSKPKMVKSATTFDLYPQVPQAGYITYLKTPPTPNAVYIYVGRNPEYQPLSSTQLGWRDNHINVIIMRALSTIGINLNVGEIVQYAEQKAAQEK